MSEKTIKLQVPDEVPEGFVTAENKTAKETRSIYPEYLSQGNEAVTLVLGETVEVENRRFADWLVRECGLVVIEAPLDDEYPADFPHRKIFIKLLMPIEYVRTLERDVLIAIKGINEKGVDAVLEYFAAQVPVEPVNEENTEDDTDNGSEADNGGE